MVQANRQIPRATIHKQILDAAAAAPEASIEELAADVSGASVGLVERVLDQYGDPPETGSEDAPEDAEDEHQMSSQDSLPEPHELTDEQRVVLQAIRRQPNATQSELAEQVGVSASTINRRLHKIEGFDWKRRKSIIEHLLPVVNESEPAPVASDGGSEAADSAVNPEVKGDHGGGPDGRVRNNAAWVSEEGTDTGADVADIDSSSDPAIGILHQRIDRLEQKVEQETIPSEPASLFDDSELAAKVIRACMNSETITDDEELRVIEMMLSQNG